MLYIYIFYSFFFFFSSRRRHTSSDRDWSSDVCSSDLAPAVSDRDRGPPHRQSSRQPVERGLHAGHEVTRGEQLARVHPEGGKSESALLHRIALHLKQHHDHGDAEQHLRRRSK